MPYWLWATGVNQALYSGTLAHLEMDCFAAVKSSSPADQQSQVDHTSLEIRAVKLIGPLSCIHSLEKILVSTARWATLPLSSLCPLPFPVSFFLFSFLYRGSRFYFLWSVLFSFFVFLFCFPNSPSGYQCRHDIQTGRVMHGIKGALG